MLCTIIHSYGLEISGIVKRTSGVPVEGVKVYLDKLGYLGTSDTDGRFKLEDVSNSILLEPNNSILSDKILITENSISVKIEEIVNVNVYNMKGCLVFSALKEKGTYNSSIELPLLSSGIYIFKIRIKEMELNYKVGLFSNKLVASTIQKQKKSHRSWRDSSTTDIIRAEKSGFVNYKSNINTLDTNEVEITLVECVDSLIDIEGNLYQAVQIGNQVWTVENFKSTKYTDGTVIQIITDGTEWCNATDGAYCYMNNDSIMYKAQYGAMYNWYAFNTNKLIPDGWHLPSIEEFAALQTFLIENGYNWDKLSEGHKYSKSISSTIGWKSSDIEGTPGNQPEKNNITGLNMLPGGYRQAFNSFTQSKGRFIMNSEGCRLLSSSKDGYVYYRYFYSKYDATGMSTAYEGDKGDGYYIRLIKDN